MKTINTLNAITMPKKTMSKNQKTKFDIRDIIIIVSVTMIFLISIISRIATVKAIEKENTSYYTVNATVTAVNTRKKTTIFTDNNGNMWEYETTKYQWNDKVVLRMSDNATPNSNIDDIIIKIIH